MPMNVCKGVRLAVWKSAWRVSVHLEGAFWTSVSACAWWVGNESLYKA